MKIITQIGLKKYNLACSNSVAEEVYASSHLDPLVSWWNWKIKYYGEFGGHAGL